MIVVGFIDTAEGHAALEAALHEARHREESLYVVVQAPRGAETADIEQAADQARDVVQESGLTHQLRTLERGDDAAEALMSSAEQEEASLIIIGLRRRSPLGKLILGSNAQRILLEAPCPVLAVKPELT